MDARSELTIRARLACPKCTGTFSNQSNLDAHSRKLHNTDIYTEQFPCTNCDKVFEYKKNWRSHFKKHHSKLSIALKVAEKKVKPKIIPSSFLVDCYVQIAPLKPNVRPKMRQIKNQQTTDKSKDLHFTLEEMCEYVQMDHAYALPPLMTHYQTPTDCQLETVFGNTDLALWNTYDCNVVPVKIEIEELVPDELVPCVDYYDTNATKNLKMETADEATSTNLFYANRKSSEEGVKQRKAGIFTMIHTEENSLTKSTDIQVKVEDPLNTLN